MSNRKLETLKTLEQAARTRRENRIRTFEPYPKQREFIAATADHSEVALRAGNQQGKSEIAAFFVAVCATGLYPDWWPGRRWDRPVKIWACGESTTAVRDVSQRKLLGPPGDPSAEGTGFLPKATIAKTILGHGAGGAIDKVLVDHVSGGKSEIRFLSYDQERAKWQGESIDLLWCDEEPDEEHYLEGLARTIATGGLSISTFTPLNGLAQILPRFSERSPEAMQNRALIAMCMDDAEHLRDPVRRTALLATFPAHQRRARIDGLPMLGSGAVFPIEEETIKVAPFDIPAHWPRLWGIDPGVGHPFAAVQIAWDRDVNGIGGDVIYVVRAVRMKDARTIDHVMAMGPPDVPRGIPAGGGVPVAWPQDAHQRREFEGALSSMAAIYKRHGLLMLPAHATFPDGGNSTEAGIAEMWERMTTGRLKVFTTLGEWFEEFREYHRKDGILVKTRDDLMSATRVAVMAKRFARVARRLNQNVNIVNGTPMARDLDTDPWARDY
jgi:phage terminase large subunit-like protein